MDNVFGGDKLKKVQDMHLVDLLQVIQTNNSSASKWLRTDHINRIKESVKDLS